MPHAKPSNKTTAKMTLTLGMATFQLNVYTGLYGDHGVSRHQFIEVPVYVKDDQGQDTDVQDTVEVPTFEPDGTPILKDGEPVMETVPKVEFHSVGAKPYDKETDEDVARPDIVMRTVTDYGYVPVTDAEIEQLLEVNKNSLRITAFQPIALFRTGQYIPKKVYYTVPSKPDGKNWNKDLNRAYATLLAGMQKEGAMALVEMTMRGIPKPAVLLPDGSLWELYFTDEIREQNPMPETEPIASEVQQARDWLRMYWDDNVLDVSDKRSALIQDFADKKAKAGNFNTPVEVEEAPAAAPASGFDFGAIIQASIDAKQAENTEEAS